MSLAEKIETIDLKVRQLAKELERLREENERLHQENHKLKTLLANRNDKVSVLKDKLEQIQQEMEEEERSGGTKGAAASRKLVDQYFDELDRCIEWLQNS